MFCFSAISFMVLFFQAFYPVDNLLEIKSGDSIVSSGLIAIKKSYPSQCFQSPALFFPSPHLTSITLSQLSCLLTSFPNLLCVISPVLSQQAYLHSRFSFSSQFYSFLPFSNASPPFHTFKQRIFCFYLLYHRLNLLFLFV